MTEQAETATLEIETIEGTAGQEPTPEIGESTEARMMRMEAALKKANHEAAKYRKQAEGFEMAERQRKEAELSEMEKLAQRLAEAEAEANRLKLIELQRQAAEKAGLPPALATRLQGATPEELEADAMALAETLPKSTKTPPNVQATNPGGNATGKGETDAERRRRLLG